MSTLALRAGALLAAVVVDVGCSGDHAIFYDVVQTRIEECAIRSNGEFCAEPDQFEPPVATVWMVEYTPEISRVYIDEEVFPLEALAEGEDPLSAEHQATRRNTVVENDCSTERELVLRFRADTEGLSGSLAQRAVLTGPAACGATPTGDRTLDELTGTTTTADGFPVGP